MNQQERHEFQRDYLDDEISRFLINHTDSYWEDGDTEIKLRGNLDAEALAKMILELGFTLG